MKRKEIAKRAIAFTASMVMWVTSIPVNLAAGPAEITAAEKSLDSISSDGANESNGPGGAETGTGSGEAGDPDGIDQGAGSGGAGEPGGTGEGGSSGENGDSDGITPGAGSGETNGPDGTEAGENTGEAGGQDGTEPGENAGEAGGQDGTEPGGSGGESGGAEGTEPGQDSDNIQQPPSEPGRTTAIDWTNNMDVLTISLSGISWESQEGAGNCVRNDQGQWDLSALYEEEAQIVTLNYDISMNNDSREPLAAGDTFSIALPSGLFAAEPDSGNLNPEKEKPEAVYTTSNSIVQVTLWDEVEQEGFSGFQASFGIKAVPLSYEPGETERIETIVMQSMTDAGGDPVRENKAEFFLPAKDGEEPGPDDNGLDKPEEELPEDGNIEENPEDGKTGDEAPRTDSKDLSNEISVDLVKTELEVGANDTVELPVVYIIPEATEIKPNDSFALSVDGITLISAAATNATASEKMSPMVLTTGEAVPEIPEEDGSTEITSPPEKTEISVSQPIIKENQVTTKFTEPAVAAAQLQGTILLRASVSRLDAEKGKATFSIQGKNYAAALLLPKTDEGNKQVSFTKEWIGTSPETVYPDLLESGMVKVWYSLGDAPANEWKSGDLGIEKWEKGDKGNYTVTSKGVGFETYTLTLPEEWKGQAVTYSFTEDAGQAIKNGYIAANTAPDAENRFRNIVTAEFEAELEIRDGDTAKDLNFFEAHLTLSGKDADGNVCEWKLTELPGNASVSVTDDHLVITNLPGFTLAQEEIIYSLKADEKIDLGDSSEDYYDPTYDNQAAANFGTVTDTCHNGGTLILLLKGETSYEGTKEWIDDKSDATKASRPDAELYLWRYSKAGSDYTTASQVKDPENENQNVSWPLNPKTKDIETVSKSNLPKYDPEGYKYTYFAKEILSGNNAGNYEQVLGAITRDSNGNAVYTDTYRGPEGQRPEGDYSLYEGGTLSNRRVGKVSLTVTKKWEAASFQDQLENVTVYMTLQCKPAGKDSDAWTDIPGEYKLDGFFAEQMSKTLTASADQFDPFGMELEYRWAESDVKQIVDGQEQGTNFDKDNRTFSLRQSVDGVEEEIEYQSSYDETDSTMTNRIADTTDYTVEKHWKGTRGDKIPPEPNSKVTVILYRSDDETKPYSTFSMDGNTDADKTGLDNPAVGYGQETEPYIMKFTGLPKYDASGHRYTYIAEEEAFSVNGQPWHTTYKYDVKERKADITNEPTGKGTIIRVRKKWVDDSDESHRIPVQVQVFDKKTDEKVGAPVTLDSTNNWWAEVGVEKDTKAEDYYIRELQTEALWSQDAASAEDTDTQKIFEPDSYANSVHHKYFVTYNNDTADARGMLCVTNRRVGLVDLTVTKKWVDQDNNADRPTDLKLKLYCQEHEDAIDYTNNTINLGNDSLSIKLSDGSEGSATQTVAYDTQRDTYTYSFYNLPKYDGEGKVVHYYIKEEEGTPDSIAGAEYATPVISYGTYIPGRTSDSPDTQEITVTNKKSKAKPVTFYKLWKDAYAYGQGKRPDIYLDLWKTDSENSIPVPVPDHINYLWTRDSDPTNSAYKWTCDFGDLPKYDSNGKEITYYAEEKTHVSADALGYDTSPEAVMDKDGIYKEQYPSTQSGQTGTENSTISAEGKTLLKEGGTFVNRLTGRITITGKKIWKNIPDGMPFEDFPGLTIKASRSLTAPLGGKTTVDVQQLVRLMKPGIRPLLVTPVHNGFVKTGSDTWEEIASTKLSVENRIPGTNDFMFTMNKTGDNDIPDSAGADLDKYDEDGNLYYYKVEEEVTNAENLSGTTYESLPGKVNNFIITNVYNQSKGNTGNLTVNKTWDGIAADDLKGKYQYPAVEFTLWRNYESNAADSTKTISKDEKVTVMRLKSGTDTSGTVTFENLLVTAPNGNKYNYFVEEKILNGYDTTDGKDTETRKSESVTLEKTRSDAAEFTAVVSFKNVYNPKQKVSLTGAKEWKDNENVFNTRPSFDDFIKCYTVYRYADKQPDADGAPEIKDEDITGELQGADEKVPYYLKWSNTDTDTWTYSISNLDRYAPNSMPWKYKIKEQKIQGYDNSDQTIDSGKEPLDDSGNITMPEWINLNLKCAKLVKSWQGENSYGLRPGTIAAELWVKLGDGAADGEWKKASEVLADFGAKAKDIPTTADVKPNNSGKWEYTFEMLPAYLKKSDGNIVSCSYQVVETKAGDYATDISQVKVSDDGVVYPKVGPYQPESGKPELNPDLDTTAITNNYGDDTKYLKITKTWKNDSNNYYSTRPVDNNKWYADFALYQKAEGETNWSQYKNAEGKNIILRVTGNNNQDTAAMKFGPFPAADSKGKAYSYAAAETTPANGNYKISETVTVEDGTETLTVTPDTTADKILTVSGTEITGDDIAQYASQVSAVNSLLTTKVTITKKWEDDGNTAFRPGNIKISLKKSIAGDKGDTITDVPMENQPDWTKNDNNTWTAVIENLPAYDEKGQRYEYTAEEEQLSNYQPPEISDTVSDSDINIGEALTITNEISQFEISKILTGGRDEESLPAGTRLEIYKASDGAAAGEPAAIWECSTGEGNAVKVTTTVKKADADIWTETVTAGTAPVKGVIKGLDAGNYILREAIAPAGYETAADIPFTLKGDGTVSLTAGGTGSVASDGNGIYCITMTDRKISVQIQKVNLDGRELTGAEFDVTGTFANKKKQQTLTPEEANKAGYLVSSDGTNPQHIYSLTETKAPERYIKSEAPTTFWTDKNGIVHIISDNKISGGTKLAETDKSDNSKIIYRNAPILLYLEKHDKTGDDTSALKGAVFTLTDKGTDGKGTNVLSDNVITTSGSLLLNNLIQGHYYSLGEKTAPDGYILPAEDSRTFTFQVSKAGKIENLNGPEGFWELEKDDTLIKIFNAPIVMELKKTDKASGEGIEGTSFTLHDQSAQGTAEDKTVVTDSKGRLTLKGPEHGLVQGHAYTLTETPAEGYDLPENKLTIAFEVNQDGTIKISKANYTDGNSDVEVTDRVAGSPAGKAAAIQIQNIRQKGSAEILKVDGDEITKVLSGAVFRLQKKNDKDEYEDVGERVTTGGDGKAYFESLEWGDYRIREVTPPAGYALSETVFDFTISATSLKALFTDAASDNAFKNGKTNVKILKKEEGSSGNPALDGARFAVYKLDGPDKEPAGSPVWESDTSAPGTMQLSGVLSVETYYAIAETSAPAGYEKLEQYVILKLNKNGQCEIFDHKGEERWTVDPGANQGIQRLIAPVTVTAADTPLNVELYKVADTGTQEDKTFLEGAELTVSGKFKELDVTEVIINKDNFDKNPLKYKLLAGETYIIRETAAPTGYTRFTGAISFKLEESGKISQCEIQQTDGAQAEDYDKDKYAAKAVWIHDTPLKAEVIRPQICKSDDAGTPIQGISFALTGKLGDTINKEVVLTSDEKGSLLTDDILSQMHVGEIYTLKEKYKEPSAYEELKEEIRFRINDNGSITLDQDNGQTATVSDNILKIVNTRTSFDIIKVDGSNQQLAGAELTIYTNHSEGGEDQPKDIAKDVAGTELRWITDKDAPKTVIGLAIGTYWLVETETPYGYQTAAPVKFVLDPEGKVSAPENTESIADDGLSITMKDEEVRGHITLIKTEAGTDTGINGAEFTLYKLADGVSVPNPETDMAIARKLTTGELKGAEPDTLHSGIWSSENSEITNNDTGEPLKKGLRAGTYYFAETKSPDHYQLDSTPSETFIITGDVTDIQLSGTVTSGVITDPKGPVQIALTNSLISAEKHQRFLTICKEDAENQEALADAVFTLARIKDMDGRELENPQPVTVDGAEEVKTVIGADGKASVTFGPLTDKGTYRLTEIAAPDGYALNRTVQEFDVVVTDHKAEDLEAWEGSLTGGRIQLKLLEKDTENPIPGNTVKNERKTGSVRLKKVDEDGAAGLNGVAFRLLFKAGGAEDFQEINYSFQTGNAYSLEEGKTWNKNTAEPEVTVNALTDSQAGVLEIYGLAWGTYRLEETQQLPGYINKAEAFEFEVGSKADKDSGNEGGTHGNTHILDVTVGYGEDGQPTWEAAAKGHVLKIKNEKTRVSFIKRMKDEADGLPGMTGAEFILEGKFADNTKERRWTTAETPEVLEGVLIGGEKYILTETKAPEGAVPANNFQVTFTMNEEGTLTQLTDQQPDNKNSEAWAKFETADGSHPARITVFDAPVTMKVFKKGTDTADSGAGDVLLKGCTFEVSGRFAPYRGVYGISRENVTLTRDGVSTDRLADSAEKEIITVITTGSDDSDIYNALSGRLIVGEKYTIKEITPPDGYALGMEVSFTIREVEGSDGKVTAEIVLDDLDSNYDIIRDENGNVVLAQRDNPVGLKLHKTGSNRPGGLNGAKFTLTGVKLVDGREVESLPSLELESSADENADPEKDGWIDLTGKVNETNTADGITTEYRYTLKETQAPSGYSRAEEFTFRLESTQDGNKIPESRFVLLDKDGSPIAYGTDGNYPAPYTYLSRTAGAVNMNGKDVGIDIISITNQYVPPVYVDSHTVEKIWDDKDNEAGKRPVSIEVQLMDENNQAVSYGSKVTLDESNGWKYTWYGLSKYSSYHAVEVTDLSDTGYTAAADTEGHKTVITNTYKAAEPSQTPTPEITPTLKPEQSVTPVPTEKPTKPTTVPEPTKKPVKPTDAPKPSGTPGVTVSPTSAPAPGTSGGSGNGGSSYGSGNSNGTDTSSASGKTPAKTGDETNVLIYLVLLIVSGTVITGCRRRSQRNQGK